MKTILLKFSLALLLIAGSQFAKAQCDHTVTLQASKTNFMDTLGNIQRSKAQDVILTLSKTGVSLDYGDTDHLMQGKVTASTCDWKTPYKDGKWVIKAILADPSGTTQDATLTILAIAGKVTLNYQSKERPGMVIQLIADKFEEKKP